jgi:hypothetical protein
VCAWFACAMIAEGKAKTYRILVGDKLAFFQETLDG